MKRGFIYLEGEDRKGNKIWGNSVGYAHLDIPIKYPCGDI